MCWRPRPACPSILAYRIKTCSFLLAIAPSPISPIISCSTFFSSKKWSPDVEIGASKKTLAPKHAGVAYREHLTSRIRMTAVQREGKGLRPHVRGVRSEARKGWFWGRWRFGGVKRRLDFSLSLSFDQAKESEKRTNGVERGRNL
jgi:hypothetical protein